MVNEKDRYNELQGRMKASDLISKLQTLIQQHGDLDICLLDSVEYNDWYASGVKVYKNVRSHEEKKPNKRYDTVYKDVFTIS